MKNKIKIILGLMICAGCATKSQKTNGEIRRPNQIGDVGSAENGTHRLIGAAAVGFIERYVPQAEIPGNFEASFYYGDKQDGYAKCLYPSVQSDSAGEFPFCRVTRESYTLRDAAAIFFIKNHFPGADMPGSVEGEFKYFGGKGRGYAKCFYPDMVSSSGEVPFCSIKKDQYDLRDRAAVDFIRKYFPNGKIPGHIEGKITYEIDPMRGQAKCSYPAMGARSNGEVPTCDVTYSIK